MLLRRLLQRSLTDKVFGNSPRENLHKSKFLNANIVPKTPTAKKILLDKDLTLLSLSHELEVKLPEVVKVYQELEADENPNIETFINQEVAELIVKHFKKIPVISEKEVKIPRSPIVTIMGHVDHGKTTLLDSLRNSKICASEFGGITQSIGAFKVKTAAGSITFIDTPGHLAFENMRQRGAEITDIIVLVVCASEGVQPQTLECIKHAQTYDTPIVVAINKIDLASAEVERVEMELLKAGILLDKYGGETMHVPISAKKKIGLDKLEETILFKAELMELQEAADVRARGFIIESKILEGRGSLCSLIVKRGTLKIGDPIVAGSAHGIVKKLLDENMKEVKTASLSEAVEVIGFKGLPNMGDPFTVTTTIKRAEVIASYMKKSQTSSKLEEKRPEDEKLILPRMSSYERRKFMNRDPSLLVERLKNEVDELDSGKKSLEEISSIQKLMKFNEKTVQEHIDMISSLFDAKHEGPNVKIILKAKNMGMLEAMENTVKSLDNKNGVKLNIISAQIGSITNDDITIAEMFKAAILCMNVKLENNILAQAEKLKIPIKSHKIIYHLLQDVENLIKDQIMTEKIIVSGKAEVKNIYEISDKGKGKIKVAGLTVIDGSIIKRLLFKILRNGEEIASGLKVSSLKILKENAKEVKKGSECGLIFEDFDELKQGDLICSYEVKQLEKSFKNERKEVSFEDVKDK